MKILHTSDWHLGISVHGISMLDEQRHFAEELIGIIKDNDIGAVIVSGDVFDSTVASGEAISLYNDIATAICRDLGVILIVIAGNHDGAARLSSMHALLEKSGLYVYGTLERDIKPIILDNAAVYPIPYFNTDKVRSLYPDEEITSADTAMNCVCNHIYGNMDNKMFNIAVAHAFVSGAELSESDRSAVIVGTSVMVSKSMFDKFSYTALGHLHKPQNVSDFARYSGTPVKYSFSEAAVMKSVTVIDTKTGEISEIPLTPIHDMRVIKGTQEEVLSAEESEDYIKAEITDRYAGMEIFTALKEKFPNLMQVVGKTENGSEGTTISAEKMEKLSPDEILKNFFEDIYGISPDSGQAEMFAAALEKAERGDGLE